MNSTLTPQTGLDADACYLALKAHDARFDGSFFTAVTSTGIYCRPVCRVKTPRRENCRFFQHAAQAEAAGFRPCLRCRPELAPRAGAWTTEDATRTLALQAARLIDEPDTWSGNGGDEDDAPATARIAQRLGVSDRHLRRLFEKHLGVSPLQYLQTRRLLAAKQLIADTQLPMAQVALASGFASVRRFNAAFTEHYGLNPSAMRRSSDAADGNAQGQPVRVRIGLRPPYDAAQMMAFFGRRALGSVELVQTGGTGATASYARTLGLAHGGHEHHGWLRMQIDEAREQAQLEVSPSLAGVLPIVISRCRALFDLDADPLAINAVLHDAFPSGDGLRVPGTVDGFELAVRAVLGQQVTVAAARTFGTRLVQAFGKSVDTPIPGLDRLFPAPEALAEADGDALGQLGIVRQRQAALQALAREVAAGRLVLRPGAELDATLAALQALPGIGAWTAQYIAMRALRWPDAFPAGDVALQKALGVGTARAAELASSAWKPWRSYAVLRAWHGAAAPSTLAAKAPT
ncbi:Ada metal-binding domain-containing protein [Variovorax dokdonensis]|uniref:DNA-3-methyladenine glycosylase II n=1 Tax=Variovorax dokdonensis TaxID=344883 RepID=A0ABT7N7G8_9BURK|nr:Ada metal-binding domain-containing protein [Variovorax dokdonensis]MDM0043875.1 Ada metal-binding domain-containing protein [Variovorax dokdonensis]